METSLIRPNDSRWPSLLNKARHDFYHVPGYVELEADRMGGEARAFLAEHGDSFFLLPLVLRPLRAAGKTVPGFDSATDAISPYGYPCPLYYGPGQSRDEDFISAALDGLKKEMSANGTCCAFVRLHPIIEAPRQQIAQYGTVMDHGQTVWIDLSIPESELWRNTRATYRNNINKLKKDGCVARMDESWELLPKFVEIYDKTMDLLDAEDWYHFEAEYFTKLERVLGTGINLCVVEDSGRVTASGLFTECGGIVQYHLSGSDPEVRNVDHTKLMLDFVRSWAKERGNEVFHLGGGLGSQDDSLFFFKSGFSKLRAAFSTWRVIFDSELYQAAVRLWEKESGASAGDESDYFPPYRKPIQDKTISNS